MQNLIADHLARGSTARTATGSPTPRPTRRPRPEEQPVRAPAAPRLIASQNGPRAVDRRRRQFRRRRRNGGSGRHGDRNGRARRSGRSGVAERTRSPRRRRRSPPTGRLWRRVVKPPERPQAAGSTAVAAWRRPPRRPASRALSPARRRPGDDRGDDDSAAPGSWMIQIGATDDARQGDRSSRPGARAEPAARSRRPSRSRRKCARATAQVLPRAIRRARTGVGRIRLPLPQAQRICLFRRPRLTKAPSSPGPPSSRSPLALSLHQDILGLIDPRGKRGRAAMIWMKLLHQRSVGANDFLRARALLQAQDLEASRASSAAGAVACPPETHPGLPHASRRTGGRDMPLAG